MDSKTFRALAFIVLLAFAVRILPAAYNFVIGTDEALYLTLAGHLAAGDGFTADGIHPHSEFDPGYPMFAALVYRALDTVPFDPSLTAKDVWKIELPALLNILLLGSLLVVPIYFLAREMNPEKNSGLRAALLTAVVPALALGVPNLEAASEQLFTLALWSGWLFMWLALTRRKWFWFFLSGLAFGVAHLTRWEGLVSAGIAVLVALIWFLYEQRAHFVSLSRAAASLVLLLGGVSVLAAPYALYQTARTGSVFSTKSIVHQLHGEALASPDPFAWEKSYANYERVRENPGLYPPLPIYLWEHRAQTALNYLRNTFTQLGVLVTSPTFLFLLWLPFAIIGACKSTRAQNLFLLATLFPALIFPISVVDARYLLPLVPAGMIWAARGLAIADARLAHRVSQIASRRSRFTHRVSRIALSTLLILFFTAADLTAIFFIPRPTEFRAAGLELRGVLEPHAPVLMRKRQIAFYANVSYESIPFSDLQGVFEYAKIKNASYFELDARTTPGTRPQLIYLLDGIPRRPLEIVYNQHHVIVYKILN